MRMGGRFNAGRFDAGRFAGPTQDGRASGPVVTPPVAVSDPVIAGGTRIDDFLFVQSVGWSGEVTSLSYQWQRNGANIPGAEAGWYTLTFDDTGQDIRCIVTARNAGGSTPAPSNTIAVPAYSPTALNPLVFLNVADTATLYQDAALTIPVSGDGQTALGWADLSGNGRNATALSGPTFWTAPDRLAFDRVDDNMTIDFTGLASAIRDFLWGFDGGHVFGRLELPDGPWDMTVNPANIPQAGVKHLLISGDTAWTDDDKAILRQWSEREGAGCGFADSPDAFTNTNLSQQSIDDVLVAINAAGTSNGFFNQSGGSAPSATGEVAVTALRARGWTVTVTGGF